MKISSKAQLIVLIPTVLIIVALLSTNLINFHSALFLGAEKTAHERLRTMANFIDAKNLEAVYTAKSMALMQQSGGFGQREQSSAYAKAILNKNSQFQGAYFGYEKNADSLDNVSQSDADCCDDGRYLPYYYRDGGQIKLAPLVDMESSLYYNGVKEQWKELSSSNLKQLDYWMITEPYIYDGVPIVEQTYPIIMNNKFVGIAGVDRQLTALFELVEKFKPYQTSKTFLVSRLGKFITTTHEKAKLEMKAVSESPDYSKIFSPNIQARKSGFEESIDPETGNEVLIVYAPIETGDWMLVMTVEKEELLAPVLDSMWSQIILALTLLIALAIFVGFAVKKYVVGSLNVVVKQLQVIASGEGDLTARIDLNQSDEVGDLVKAFNGFVGKLYQVVSNIVSVSSELTEVSGRLESVATEASQAVNHQLNELQTVTRASQQLASNSEKVEHDVSKASEISNAAELSAGEGKLAIQKNRDAVNETSKQLLEAQTVINELNQNSTNINGVVDVINGIAEQTNLLALNAAIEAARAGEQGRGFAVVADEVRMLAQKTQESIKEIHTTVESLKLSSVNAVKCMDLTQTSVTESVTQAGISIELLDKVADSVAETVQMNNEVNSVSGEQKLAIDAITDSIVIINNSSDTASASADKARQLSSELTSITDRLNENLAQFKT